MDHVTTLKCTICGAEYTPDAVDYVCPHHGDDGILDVNYDYDLIATRISLTSLAGTLRQDMWRYKPLLPVELDSPEPTLRVGGTPLYAAPRLAQRLGMDKLWVKDDGVNPTASFKDRASALAVVKAREAGAGAITTASTGNAAAALAGVAANYDMRAVIFVPKSAPRAKIVQQLVYGAQVLLVDGTYDEAFELTLKAARTFGWYNRNTAYNPYMTEGKKTAAYEIAEQLTVLYSGNVSMLNGVEKRTNTPSPIPSPTRGEGRSPLVEQCNVSKWHVPDCVVVPVGDGCIIGGIHKGFKDMLALGWIERIPRIIGVQAEGSAPLVHAFENDILGWEMSLEKADSCADSICAGLPRDRNKALAAVRETGGTMLAVSDAAILAAIPVIAQNTGVFCEPAAAASYAGLEKAVRTGIIAPNEETVILLTGSGLKDINTAMRTVSEPIVIAPRLDAVHDWLAEQETV